MLEILQLFQKALHFAQKDLYYLFPVIGSIQILFIGLFYKKKYLIFLSFILFLLFSALFPFAKLIPNLGSDAFSEFQKINLSEVYFYIKTLNFFAGWTIKHYILWLFIITFYIIFIFILLFISKKISFINFLNINYIIVLFIIIIPTSINFYKVSILYNSSIVEKKNQSKNIIYDIKNLNIQTQSSRNLSLIFYIGEATSRLHWSIYDYFRHTNKNLEKFAKDNPLILFDNIFSTHTHTSPSLLDTLTFKVNQKENKELKIISDYSRYPIVDILNQASINTKLYSTQAKSGSWNLASGLIFKNAKEKKYSFKHNLGNANYIDKDRLFDHEFLKEFTNTIKKDSERNNFYVFHSYAGHGNYKKNIPEKYHEYIDDFYLDKNKKSIFGKKFKYNQKEFLENYDSAMKYISDNIVFTLNEISNLEKPIIFIYTSDHGESPLTGRGHDSSRFIWEMSSVPFLIYFNDQAKIEYPDLFNKLNLRSNQNKREILGNMPSLILEVFNINIFNNDQELDKVSKCKFGDGKCLPDYHTIRNQLDTLGVVNLIYPKNYQKNYVDNTDRATTFSNMKNYFLNKGNNLEICSHRTNSIARFIRFNAILNCMEIDIIIEDEFLEVSHSKNESVDLNLEELIKIQKDKKNVLWLDVKNVKNVKNCVKLNKFLRNIKMRNNHINFFIEYPSYIIENLSDYEECIKTSKSMNFMTSFYIPNNLKFICGEVNTNRCQYSENILKQLYDSGLFTDISFDYKNYEFLKRSEYIDKFYLNTWHIPDDDILKISNENFRLVIPFNDDVNYN